MPLRYRIDASKWLVTVTGEYGDAEEWRTLLGTILRDPEYRQGFSFLRDLRQSEFPVSGPTVIGIISVVREFWEQLGVHRAAIVTGSAINDPALIAYALAADQQIPLRAFTSYDDAVNWLQEGSPRGAE